MANRLEKWSPMQVEQWIECGPYRRLFEENYGRPKEAFNPRQPYRMMNVDVTYREPLVEIYDPYLLSREKRCVSVPMLNGTDEQGRSSTVHLTGYFANFWVGVGDRYFHPNEEEYHGYAWMRNEEECAKRWPAEGPRLRQAFQTMAEEYMEAKHSERKARKGETNSYLVHMVEMSSEWHPFVEFTLKPIVALKVMVYSAKVVPILREAIRWMQKERPHRLPELFGWPLGDTYESNFPFVSNFMTDTGLVSCGNLCIPEGKGELLRDVATGFQSVDVKAVSTAQIEIAADYRDVIFYSDDSEEGKNVYPFVSLAWDIEVVSGYERPDQLEYAAQTRRRRRAEEIIAMAEEQMKEASGPSKTTDETADAAPKIVRKDMAEKAKQKEEEKKQRIEMVERLKQRVIRKRHELKLKDSDVLPYHTIVELAERIVVEDDVAQNKSRQDRVQEETERLFDLYMPHVKEALKYWSETFPEYERTQSEVRSVQDEVRELEDYLKRNMGHSDQMAAARVRLEGAKKRLADAKKAAAKPERMFQRSRIWASIFHVNGVDAAPPPFQDDKDDTAEEKEWKSEQRKAYKDSQRAAREHDPNRRVTREDEQTSRHVRRIVTDIMQGDPIELAVREMAEEHAMTLVHGAPHAPFPRPNNSNDRVTMIGYKLSVYGQPERYRSGMLVLGECDVLPTVDDLFIFDTEEDLLLAWRDLQEATQCDFTKTWNGLGFDRRYLIQRAERLKIANLVNVFGREKGKRVEIKEKNFQSGAKGALLYYIGEPPGMVHLDGFLRARDLYSLRHMRSYGLSAVGLAMLNEVKEDMPPEQMKRHMSTSRLKHKFARYCGKDVDLTDDIMEACGMEVDTITEARLTNVSPMNIVTGGQGVKCQSVLIRKCRTPAFQRLFDYYKSPDLTPEQMRERKRNKAYRGAIVVKPVRGVHRWVVFTLDFASLYPSIMHFFNICWCTLVKAGMEPELRALGYLLNEVVITKAEDAADGKAVTASFVAQYGDKAFQGVLPQVEVELKAVRKSVQKLEKQAIEEGNALEAKRYNAMQNNIKKVMNSLYGFSGAEMGKLFRKEVAASITAGGRIFLEFTIKFVEAIDPRFHIVYGDSVTGETPCVVRHRVTKLLEVRRIDELASYPTYPSVRRIDKLVNGPWSTWHGDKEQAPCEYEAWTDKGWTPIRRVIRHRIPAEKRILEVATRSGVVKVTDDHSLLRPNVPAAEERLAAKDVRVGQEIVHARLPPVVVEEQRDGFGELEAWNVGMVFYHESLELERFYWRDRSTSPFPPGGLDSFPNLFQFFQSILNMSLEIREAFYRGCYGFSSHDSKNTYAHLDIYVGGDVWAAGLIQLLASLDKNVTIDTHPEYSGLYHLRERARRNSDRTIEKIRVIPHDGCFVYDLETENHHFQAGVGEIIVHNTDSVMVEIDECEDPGEGFRLGKDVQKKLDAEFKDPVSFIEREMGITVPIKPEERMKVDSMAGVELEKVTRPNGFLLRCAKKYVMLCWTSERAYLAGKPHEELIRGSESFRRETPVFIREMVKYAEKNLLDDSQGTLSFLRTYLDDVIHGRLPIDEFVMTGGYNRSLFGYAGNLPPHAVVVKKMQERTGIQATLGDRISYVIVRGRDIKKRKGGVKVQECAEDPIWAAEHNLPIDIEYYVDRAVSTLTDYMSAVFFPNEEDEVRREQKVRDLLLGEGGMRYFLRTLNDQMPIVRAMSFVNAETGEAVPNMSLEEFEKKKELDDAFAYAGIPCDEDDESLTESILQAWRAHLRAESEKMAEEAREKAEAKRRYFESRQANMHDPWKVEEDRDRKRKRLEEQQAHLEELQRQREEADPRTPEEKERDKAWLEELDKNRQPSQPLKKPKKFTPIKPPSGQMRLDSFFKK